MISFPMHHTFAHLDNLGISVNDNVDIEVVTKPEDLYDKKAREASPDLL